MLVQYDSRARATYIALCGERQAAATIDLIQDGAVHVDLDQRGQPVGVELLMAPTEVTPAVLAPLFARYPQLRADLRAALADLGYQPAA